MTYRRIDLAPFADVVLAPVNPGSKPTLKWIEIKALVVDPSYQRDIGEAGKRNIVRIAREFDWARFSPVIVAPLGADRFVIVDGQHRTTAALLRKHDKVPCQVIDADRRKQAAAFAAINANVTAMSTMQVHAAKVAAGDPQAIRLRDVCASAGVTLLRYPIQASKQKRGETMAVVQLRQAMEKFGDDVLRAALKVITKTRDGNPGMVRGYLVLALCSVLEAEPEWLGSPRLLKVCERLDLRATWDAAAKSAKSFSHSGITAALVEKIADFLDKAFATKAA